MLNKNPQKIAEAKKWLSNRLSEDRKEADKELTAKQKVKKLARNVVVGVRSAGVNTAKATIREGRETLIAKDIAGKGLRGKKLTPSEKRFLKAQTGDLVRSAAVVGTNLIPIPAPTFKAYLGAAHLARKRGIELMPTRQVIPKAYVNKYKTRKVSRFLNNQSKSIDREKERINAMRRSNS